MPIIQASLTTILESDLVSNGPDIINGNFDELNLNATELSAGNLQIATTNEAIAATADNIAMTPVKVAVKLINTQDVVPNITNIYDLGSTTKKYSDLWMSDQIHFDSQTFEIDSNADILINGVVFTGPSLTGQFVELTGPQVVGGVKTFVNQMINTAGLELSGTAVDIVFDETGSSNSGIAFQDNGANIAEIRYKDASAAIKVGIFDSTNYSWQFTSEIIFGEGEKSAPDFVSGVADNGIIANKIKRYKTHVTDAITTLSGALVPVDWSGSPVFNLYPDEGESGNVILAQKETDIFLPPLTRDGGATNSGGITYTIVNMSSNANVEIFADASITDLINGAASISNATRFSSITLVGTYKKQFGTGTKEGHWIITNTEGTWS